MSASANGREKLCTWCEFPKFGEERCICDSPDFEWMEQCTDCGRWREVNHLHVPRDSDEENVVCTGQCL